MPGSEVATLEELLESTPQLSRTDLAHLQEWMRKQAHLPTITDLQLVPFLHSSYYSLERTKTLIDNYFTVRAHTPELFENRDIEDQSYQKILDITNIGALTKRDVNGYHMICSHLLNPDPAVLPILYGLKLVIMLMDVYVKENPTAKGYVFVMNMAGISMGHVAKVTPFLMVLKKFLFYVQEAYPIRIKAVHVINVTSLVDTIMMLVKPFLSKKLVDLLHFHSGAMEDFYREIPREILPQEFDGELGTLQERHDLHKMKTIQNRKWLLLDGSLRVDESKRVGQQKSAGEIFGVEGSFKQLSID